MDTSDNCYREYLRDTLRLFAFLDEGTFDSEDAERLRDTMEEPWLRINETDKRRIRGLVADLNYIREENRPVLPVRAGRDILAFASQLRNLGQVDEALRVVRNAEPKIFQPFLSFFRGRAWMLLGANEVALEFFRDATKLDQADQFQMFDVYSQVLRMVDLQAANKLADEVLTDPDSYPASRVAFAAEAKQAAIDDTAKDALSQYGALVPIVRDALDRMLSGEFAVPPSISMTAALLAHVSEMAGDKDAAYRAMTTLIKHEQNEPILYALRGNLFFPEERGVSDYLTATRGGVDAAWPYMRLAKLYLNEGKYENSGEVCESGLTRLKGKIDNTASSELLNMLAISKAGAGGPPWLVEELFLAAISADAENDRPKRNLGTYRNALIKAGTGRHADEITLVDKERWEQPSEEYLLTIEKQESSRARRKLIQTAYEHVPA